MKENNKHIEERIHAYVHGKLTDAEADELWAEIMEDPDLLEVLKTNVLLKKHFSETEEIGEENQEATITNLQEKSDFSRHKGWILALAAMILITIGLNLLRTDHHPMMVMALNDISLLEIETVPVTRSQAAFLVGADSLLFFAYEAAVRNDEIHAFELYDALFQRYPESLDAARAKLNVGILRYNRREYEEAESYFLSGLDIPHSDVYVLEKTHWYLANTYINLQNYNDARREVLIVYTMNGVFREAAYQLLRKLNIALGEWDHTIDQP